MDFENLRDVVFAEVDTDKLIKSAISVYEGIMNTTLYAGNPVRLFLMALCVIRGQDNAILDWTSKQNLLKYAVGNYLEHLGAWLGVFRLSPTPARCTLMFSLQQVRNFPTTIPMGTRATADGKVFFSTDAVLLIPAGEISGEVSATCLSEGSVGNELMAGQINRMVDSVAFVNGVENINTTNGGSDIETDSALRARIRLKPDSFTTAGSRLAYQYWSFTAHVNIGDVAVVSPIPGIVNIFVMLRGGEQPEVDSAEIMAVKEIFGVSDIYGHVSSESGDRLRPLTDLIFVFPINVEPVNYTIKWWVTDEQAVDLVSIKEAVHNAVSEYEVWQTEKAGRDIVPDKLIKLCLSAGAKRVELKRIIIIDDVPVEIPFVHSVIGDTTVVNFIENEDRIIDGGVEKE